MYMYEYEYICMYVRMKYDLQIFLFNANNIFYVTQGLFELLKLILISFLLQGAVERQQCFFSCSSNYYYYYILFSEHFFCSTIFNRPQRRQNSAAADTQNKGWLQHERQRKGPFFQLMRHTIRLGRKSIYTLYEHI